MKIRNGFVSNSSSSNFIIKLDVIPTSEKHLAQILGVCGVNKLDHWGDYYDRKQIVNTIYEDIIRELNEVGDKTTIKDIDFTNEIYIYSSDCMNEFKHFINPSEIDKYEKFKPLIKYYDAYNSKIKDQFNQSIKWQKSQIVQEGVSNMIINGIINSIKNNDSKFIKLTYADEDGEIGGYIEHSGILDPITFMKFNHH